MTTSDSVLTGPRPTSVPSVGPVVAELEDEIVSFRRDLHLSLIHISEPTRPY